MANLHAASVRIARAVHQGTPQEEADARRDLAAAKIAKAIERALAVAPPLTSTQVRRLTGLLRTEGKS